MGPAAPVKMRISRKKSPRLREERFEAVLRCGLRACILPRPGFHRKIAIFTTRYGSTDLKFRTAEGRDVLDTPPGIAHFLEHQLFKKEGNIDLLMEFGQYGANSNAFTDYTTTNYYFSTSGGFDPSLETLIKLTYAPFWNDEYVAREKLIIEQELKMYEDMPDYRAYRALVSALYREHPVRLDIGGSVKSIQDIDAQLLESCYKVFYHPSNMVFVAAGDLDAKELLERLDAALPPERFTSDRVIERNLPDEPSGVGEERVEENLLVSRPRVLMGIKDLNNGNLLQRDLTTTAMMTLIFGRSGKFYNKHYESGLIDDSFSFSYSAEEGWGFSVIGGETEEPDKLIDLVRKEFQSALKGRFKKRDVERTKRKMIGKYLRAFDTPDNAAFLTAGCLIKGQDPYAIPAAIQKLSTETLARRLKQLYKPENLAVSVVNPKK